MDFETFSNLLRHQHQIIAAMTATRIKGHSISCNTGYGPNIVVSDETSTDIKNETTGLLDEGTIGDIKGRDMRRDYLASEFRIELEEQVENLARFYEILKPGQELIDLGSSAMAFRITGVEQGWIDVVFPQITIEFTVEFVGSGAAPEVHTIEII